MRSGGVQKVQDGEWPSDARRDWIAAPRSLVCAKFSNAIRYTNRRTQYLIAQSAPSFSVVDVTVVFAMIVWCLSKEVLIE